MLNILAAICARATNRFELWAEIARVQQPFHFAELGVWQGEFAASMLQQLPQLRSYLLIDPWRPLKGWNKPLNVGAEQFEAARLKAVEATAFAGSKARVLRGKTLEVEGLIPDGSLDLVYIDGDHTLRGITIDLIRMFSKVRPGGIIGGDDYLRDPWHHGLGYEPTLVCPFARHFAEAMDLPFFALPFNQYLIIKDQSGHSFTNLSTVEPRLEVGKPSLAKALLRTLQPFSF